MHVHWGAPFDSHPMIYLWLFSLGMFVGGEKKLGKLECSPPGHSEKMENCTKSNLSSGSICRCWKWKAAVLTTAALCRPRVCIFCSICSTQCQKCTMESNSSWGFNSCLISEKAEFACSACASRVSSKQLGFLPSPKHAC